MKCTTVTLPDELVESLAQEAYRRRTSVSHVVRETLEQAFAPETPRLPWRGLVADGSRPARDMNDELATTWNNDTTGNRR